MISSSSVGALEHVWLLHSCASRLSFQLHDPDQLWYTPQCEQWYWLLLEHYFAISHPTLNFALRSTLVMQQQLELPTLNTFKNTTPRRA